MGNDEVKGWGKYGTTDRLLQAFDAGPFPAVHVEPWPPALVELVTRQTGHRFDPDVLAAYERAKAFLGHEAVQLTPALIHQQWAEDPYPKRAELEPTTAPTTSQVAPRRLQQSSAQHIPTHGAPAPVSGGFDPNDLGD